VGGDDQPHYARLCAWIHSNTKWKTFLHSCGSIHGLIPHMIEAGVDILNPIQTSAANMEPERLVAEFGGKIVFWAAAATPSARAAHGNARGNPRARPGAACYLSSRAAATSSTRCTTFRPTSPPRTSSPCWKRRTSGEMEARMLEGFSYRMPRWHPFQDQAACERVRGIKREDVTKTPSPHLKINMIRDDEFTFRMIMEIFGRIKQASTRTAPRVDPPPAGAALQLGSSLVQQAPGQLQEPV